jgi:hypothetical protein
MQDKPSQKRRPAWRKPLHIIGGGILVFGGLILLVLPGPGLLVMAGGLALWAREFDWAQRWLDKVETRIRKIIEQSKTAGK